MDLVAISLLIFCIRFVECNWSPEMENTDNPNAYEGDMILTPKEAKEYYDPDGSSTFGSIVGRRWPRESHTTGRFYPTVPYEIKSNMPGGGRSAIAAAIRQYEKHTCIRFRAKKNGDREYLRFVYPQRGCSSYIGRRPYQVNEINLASGCWRLGITMHEIGHSLGFFHEQSRPDRDNYVQIIMNNVPARVRNNFRKEKSYRVDSLGTPYDYLSMMHYGSSAFGGGRMTIRTKDPKYQNLIGQRGGFSKTDIKQLNLMYKCSGYTKGGTTKQACKVKFEGGCYNWGKIRIFERTDKKYTQKACQNLCESTNGCAAFAQHKAKRDCTLFREGCKSAPNENKEFFEVKNCKGYRPRQKKTTKAPTKAPTRAPVTKKFTMAPKSGKGQVISCDSKGRTGGCLNWFEIRISENFGRRYTVQECGQLCEEEPRCAAFNMITRKMDCTLFSKDCQHADNPAKKLYYMENCKVQRERVHPCDAPTRGGCEQECVKAGNRALCSCDVGYKLNQNGKTCTQAATCEDKNTNCNYWRTEGYCEGSFEDYMRKNCSKVCGYCS